MPESRAAAATLAIVVPMQLSAQARTHARIYMLRHALLSRLLARARIPGRGRLRLALYDTTRAGVSIFPSADQDLQTAAAAAALRQPVSTPDRPEA